MHRTSPVALAGLLLAAAVAARGAEAPPGGTLDQTKAELRQLQSDQRNKAGQQGGKLKLDAPTMDVQVAPDAASPEAWLSDKLKQERKLKEAKDAKKNWLVDGVEKLEKEGSHAKDAAAVVAKDVDGSQSAPHAIDPSDPQYLLKLFDEQKKPAEGKASANKATTATPDAFAPFMQSWLGSSPVKGQLMDQFVSKTDNGGTPVLPGDYRGPTGPANAPVAVHDAVGAPKENPYLADLNTPILTKEVAQDAAQLSSGGAPAASSEVARSAPVLPASAPAADTRERPKGPPPSPADDKKYFPQLKRF